MISLLPQNCLDFVLGGSDKERRSDTRGGVFFVVVAVIHRNEGGEYQLVLTGCNCCPGPDWIPGKVGTLVETTDHRRRHNWTELAPDVDDSV